MPGAEGSEKMALRFLLWVILALIARFVFRGLRQRMASVPDRGGMPPSTVYKGLMVRDPVCGLHIPESRALVDTRAGERFHFCSRACQAAFRNSAS